MIFSALIKLCRIKGEIKGGCEPFFLPDQQKIQIYQGKPAVRDFKKSGHHYGLQRTLILYSLVRTRNAEFNHPRLQSRPFHAEPGCRTRGPTDDPVSFTEDSHDVLPFRVCQSRKTV